MNIVTVDWESYYDKDFSLGKLTTEEYIRSEQFEEIGIGVKVNDEETEWASGSRAQLRKYLSRFDWENSLVLAHHARFDGAILNWHYGIRAGIWADTLCMARALHGVDVGGLLAALVKRYDLGEKGTEVIDAEGKRRADFTPDELARYGDYCVNDVELTRKLFFALLDAGFPTQELRVIDKTLRMFIEPILELDKPLLEQYLQDVREEKQALIDHADVTKKELMSNTKFAQLLRNEGVDPPKKISPTTGKPTYAFAKTDTGFQELLEHDSPYVQALAAARIGNKSTIEETRTERFIGIAERGRLPAPIKYCAARTTRWGGDEKANLQNLRSRGTNKTLKQSIMAPEGYVLVDADLSQIEARILAWFAEQDDLVEAFAAGEKIYEGMAADVYGIDPDVIAKDSTERFVGKELVLACGYQLGWKRFQLQLAQKSIQISDREAQRAIEIYRKKYPNIKALWDEAQFMLRKLVNGDAYGFGRSGVIGIDPEHGIRMPSGLYIRYPELVHRYDGNRLQFFYKTRKGETNIYGGNVVQHVCQGLARCVIAEQMVRIPQAYFIALTVHDSLVLCVPEAEADEVVSVVEREMRRPPEWAEGLPLDCEVGVARRYGDC